MKRMSSLRLTETPMPVALMFLSLGMAVKAWGLFGCLGRRHGPHLSRPLGDRPDDVVVAGAAADVAFERVADRGLVEFRALAIDEVDGRHDHARRAEAALQAMIVLEGLLHRVQLAVRGKALDRRHLRAVAARRQDC